MKEKVIIGMSGGVDSSVAAALLKNQGYEVVGLTMKLWDGDGDFINRESDAEKDAARIAEKLGIEFHVLDLKKDFKEHVIDYFLSEYQNARTPNPCIECNRHLKFGAMLKAADDLGAEYIATGHYAKVEYSKELDRYLLKPSNAFGKDQTYVLYTLGQKQLARIKMPLGEFENKEQIRKIAAELGLFTASKPDSQEICFIPDNDYISFIRRNGISPKPGNFVDADGNPLGVHRGITNYTIGQRKGLGIAFGKPMFVTEINAKTNEVVLGEKGSEFSSGLYADNLNFIPFDRPEQGKKVLAKIRYSAKPAPASIVIEDRDGRDILKVSFEEPQRAVTPGQSVVLYDLGGETVLGGGIILKSFK